jgi:hypothetical protein
MLGSVHPVAWAVADALSLLTIARRVEVVTLGDLSRNRSWHTRHLSYCSVEAHMMRLVRD